MENFYYIIAQNDGHRQKFLFQSLLLWLTPGQSMWHCKKKQSIKQRETLKTVFLRIVDLCHSLAMPITLDSFGSVF